jgi:acyl dehydratase
MVDLHWIGATTKPVTIHIDAAQVAHFSSAVCEIEAVDIDAARGAQFSSRLNVAEAVDVVPFTYPITFWNHCDFPWLSNLSENLFLGEQDIQYHYRYRRALTVGETVSCQVTLENIVTKQGSHGDMQLLKHVMEITDDHGEPIVTLTSTLITLPVSVNKDSPESEKSESGEAGESQKVPPEVQVVSPKAQEALPELSLKKGVFWGEFSGSRIDAYANASGDLNIIHMSEEYAKQSGFPARIVHGMLIMGAAAHHLQMSAKEGWSLTGLHMRFGKPVFAGDVLSIQTGSCEGSQSFEVIRENDVCCTGRADYAKHG